MTKKGDYKYPRMLVQCACGCGAEFTNYDNKSRVRRYLPGHSTPKGEGNRWYGHILPYSFEFNNEMKNFVRMRDDYTCQLCGVHESEYYKKLTCHHIDYNKLNSMPSNLITLCVSCNSKANNHREYWINYFYDLLNKRQHSLKSLNGYIRKVNNEDSIFREEEAIPKK